MKRSYVSRRAAQLLALCLSATLVFGLGSVTAAANSYALDNTSVAVVTLAKAPKITPKADSVTVVGDSVTLGALLFANLEGRIANTKGVSWCRVDAEGSRQLADGVKLVKRLKKEGKLGSVVVYALTTNGFFDYKEAQAARKAAGKNRYVIFVTGYNKGYDYPARSNAAIKKLAKKDKKVFVADFEKVMKSHGGSKGLSDGQCHLTATGGRWYGETIIKAIGKARSAKTKINQVKYGKQAKLATVGGINLVVGDSCKAPSASWGAYTSNAKLSWSSSNSAVVSVDDTGMITAKKLGSAVITLKKNNADKDTISLTVNVIAERAAAQNMTLSVTKLKTWAYKINVSTSTQGVTGKPAFSSSDKTIATVNRAGVVVGKKAGTVKIEVYYGGQTQTVVLRVT
ncbi:MAG: Ig-like domain-containing protein [Coriobacteriales bacterium]|nr:Ig-like domain-containing protein [Coriobacteriales bacterium]